MARMGRPPRTDDTTRSCSCTYWKKRPPSPECLLCYGTGLVVVPNETVRYLVAFKLKLGTLP